MLGVLVCLILWTALTTTFTDGVLFQSHYFADTDLDDTVFYDTLLSAHHSDSLTLCFAMCGQNCHCLGYNSQKKRCHLYKSCDSVTIFDYETGWRYYNSMLEGEGWMLFGTHYYLHIKNNATWENAKFECEMLGAYLVSIDTEEENKWLTETFLPAWDPVTCDPWWFCCLYWIGANDIEQEGRFVWTENNNNVTSFSNWHPDEPDDTGGQDCVHLCRQGFWEDAGCDGVFSYICEID
ncbi:perlucin-like protein [Saccostrea cucullata]|uniref:perlucin-like protein n=1 Tax=Saccostrea cuccullata TaxID=36930 RepID=UPI002ED11EBE